MPAEQKKAASKKAESKSARPAASKKTHAAPDYLALSKKVIDLIAQDMSARAACKKAGIKISTFYKYVSDDNELYEQYARACEIRADITFDGIAEQERLCLKGKIDPKAFRSVVDSMKWRLGKMKAKSYGDKVDMNLDGKLEIRWGGNGS